MMQSTSNPKVVVDGLDIRLCVSTGHFGAMAVSNGQLTNTIMQLVDFVTTSPSLPYAYFFRCRLFYMFA